MPPKDENPIMPTMGTLYMIDMATGEETPLGPVTHTPTIEADASGAYSYNGVELPPLPDYPIACTNYPEATFTFTFTVRSKRMTRKKFLKKLMADGVPRNIANSMAEIVRSNGNSYSWGYFVIGLSGFLPWKED